MSRSLQVLLLSPLIVFVLSAVRLILVSNYSTTTATAIAQHGGVTGTLLGSFIPLVPSFLPALALVLLVTRKFAAAGIVAAAAAFVCPADMTVREAAASAWTESLNFLDLLTDRHWEVLWNPHRELTVLVTLTVTVALVDFLYELWGQKGCLWFVLSPVIALAVGAIALLGFSFVLNLYRVPFDLSLLYEALRQPWSSAEELSATTAEGVTVGYVLSTADQWTVVLKDEDRSIEYMRTLDVTLRRECRIGPSPEFDPPLLQFRDIQPAELPPCSSR